MKKILKILIPNATSPLNLGDQVMLKELLKLLKITHKNGEITVHSTDPHLHKNNSQYRVNHTLYSWSVFSSKKWTIRFLRLVLLIVYYIGKKYKIYNTFPFKDFNEMKDLINDYEKADLVIFAPGGYLRSKKGLTQTLNLFMQLVPFELAKLFHVKKIVAPISFGPFGYKWQERIAAKAIQGLDIVAAREKYSYKLMKDNKVNNIILSSDFALLLKKKERKINKNKRSILGFTIRTWFDKKRQENFEENVVNAIKKFSIETNSTIQPIVQVQAPKYGEDDGIATKKIIAKIKNKNINILKIKTMQDSNDALGIYSGIDLLLGMRTHSNLLAATQGTPFVAISYEHKTEGIAEQITMDNYCIEGEKVDKDNLYQLLIDAYKNRSYLKNKLLNSIKTIQDKETKRWRSIL